MAMNLILDGEKRMVRNLLKDLLDEYYRNEIISRNDFLKIVNNFLNENEFRSLTHSQLEKELDYLGVEDIMDLPQEVIRKGLEDLKDYIVELFELRRSAQIEEQNKKKEIEKFKKGVLDDIFGSEDEYI